MTRSVISLAVSASSIVVLCAGAGQALAQEEDGEGWSGSVEFSAASATGNSETLNVGLATEVKNEVGRYIHLVKAAFNYAEAGEIETQNNLQLSYELDVQLRDRTYAYGRVQYDQDEFSGFENRVFVGGGIGHYLIEDEGATWKIEAGPGYRYSMLEEPDPVPMDFEDSESEFAIYASSEYERLIREGVQFTHLLESTYTQSNTSLKTVAALTTKLTDSLSSKVSYEVRYETDPPAGNENTDTLLKASILFGF
ncbi:DUF481 domain-containing protein [Aquisalinus flavus]|uniref:DUF481 domain-containing protein n=1 Tax=Aquisalinus flavus TaxID=1526572 RepID=A0A8J2V2K2_9PROT|nr:DUF481 domain-containing protein [Aquisalinus flavus]MBD0427491.1 DUF481 domain-containing protein [Aquisalinus flavus]GGD01410.1 hypothetical protein GCM10011342_08040 [Aquisalinus flavus]